MSAFDRNGCPPCVGSAAQLHRNAHYCSRYYVNSALYPVIGLLERTAGFAEDAPTERLAKLEALVAQGTDRPEKAAPLIADLLGIELGERYRPLNLTPQQKKQRRSKSCWSS